jgi:hypothetical protein
MSEPTSAYSFYDLITRVAKELGIAYYASSNARAMPPVSDSFNLNLCKDIVNDAIKMFIADEPKKGWRWMRRIMRVSITGTRITGTADAADATSITDLTLADTYDADDDLNGYWVYILTGTGTGSHAQVTDYTALTGAITVAAWLDQYGNSGGTSPAADSTFAVTSAETVGGDISRYPLAENFGGSADGRIHYAADTSHSPSIDWCDESMIRENRSISVRTGYPSLAAIRSLEPGGSSLTNKRRFELILDPQPNADDVLEFPYTLYFDKMDLETGLATGGSTITIVDSARTEGDDYFNGWIVRIISGTGAGSYATVTDYTGSTGTFTVADWLKSDGSAGGTDPAANSVYYIEPFYNKHPAGFRFDNGILSACMYKVEEEDENVQKGFSDKYLKKDLPKAWEIDSRSAPRKLGSMNREDDWRRERIWNRVTTDHDM